MRTVIIVIFFSHCFQNLQAQILFERRIIIENNNFYAVEIDNHTQLAKLYSGSINEPIGKAVVYALPAGTKRTSNHEIPFAWDIYRDTLYCINYTEYAQNSHYNSLKTIPIAALPLFAPDEKPTERLLQAAYANHKIINMPLVNTYKKYMYMDDLYFDVKISDGILHEFISVQDQITVWNYISNSWQQSESMNFHTDTYFSVYAAANNFNIVSSNGDQLLYPAGTIIESDPTVNIVNKLIIENRDSDKVYFMDVSAFTDISRTVNQILLNIK